MDRLTYVVDIDGTICSFTDGNYLQCQPFQQRIDTLNQLFDAGHEIIYFTARGMGSSGNNQIEAYKSLYQFTLDQLADWGCRFSALYMGKPKGDFYIDDRGVADTDFFLQQAGQQKARK
ncbi:hypothetical protein N9E91_03190 [Alphaproteobacteria bacterium]|nr:hypothetical protein [Alphaproteobacteria bacterium]